VGENKQRMLRGELYIADDPELLEDFHRGRRLVERFNATGVAEADERRRLLEELLGRSGSAPRSDPPCDYGYLTEVGERTSSTTERPSSTARR
jgi:maltose O-acetyltransferase